MSNLDVTPEESTCPARGLGPSPEPMTLEARDVPLGGPRAMKVRRTLPHRDIRTVGAWCFVDDYGPNTPDDPAMEVPPHPHIGLQTVSWLIEGELRHRDSSGGRGQVRPGELSIMTAGAGVAHSEYSQVHGRLRGIQMWVALPEASRNVAPGFAQHTDLPRVQVPADGGSIRATVVIGSFGGAASPAQMHTPLVGAELDAHEVLERCRAVLPLRPDFEHGILALDEGITVGGAALGVGDMRYLGWGAESVEITFEQPGRAFIYGGEPLMEELVMWWNFVARSHDEIVAARQAWGAGILTGPVPEDDRPALHAPELPNARLRPRPGRPD